MLPLVFEPYLRPMVWGGRALELSFGKHLQDGGTYGESWEVSAHPHHVTRVAEGPLKGQLLTEIVAAYSAELYGAHAPDSEVFPLLLKLLDCNELLSIQVHPDDERARRLTHGREHFGKTEAWVVLEVGPQGRIYAGLSQGVDRAAVEKHLAEGTLEECLHRVTPKPGDCIFLPAGTVHAVGDGVVMAEIQQSSDATFRLYDWNRPGPDGKLRPLHIEESLASIDWDKGPVDPAIGTPLPNLPPGVVGERLVSCHVFNLDRYRAGAAFDVPDSDHMSIWLVLDGKATLASTDGKTYQRDFRRGESVLIPATAGPLTWTPAEGAPPTLFAASLP